jgi:hypothetical protein
VDTYIKIIKRMKNHKENICKADIRKRTGVQNIQRPIKTEQQENKETLGAVAYSCNPSYLGGGDQKDHNSRPAWVKSSEN